MTGGEEEVSGLEWNLNFPNYRRVRGWRGKANQRRQIKRTDQGTDTGTDTFIVATHSFAGAVCLQPDGRRREQQPNKRGQVYFFDNAYAFE